MCIIQSTAMFTYIACFQAKVSGEEDDRRLYVICIILTTAMFTYIARVETKLSGE